MSFVVIWNSWNALYVGIKGITKAMYDGPERGSMISQHSGHWYTIRLRNGLGNYIPTRFQTRAAKFMLFFFSTLYVGFVYHQIFTTTPRSPPVMLRIKLSLWICQHFTLTVFKIYEGQREKHSHPFEILKSDILSVFFYLFFYIYSLPDDIT